MQRAVALSNAGIEHASQGDYDGALVRFSEAFQIFTAVYPGSHPDTAAVAANIGCVYSKQGRFEDAMRQLELALAMQRACSVEDGQPHADAAATLTNIGRLRERQGHFSAALWFYHSALRLRQQVFGAEHPATTLAMEDVADAAEACGDVEQAALYRAHAAAAAARRASRT